jgi:hypothetical protein
MRFFGRDGGSMINCEKNAKAVAIPHGVHYCTS